MSHGGERYDPNEEVSHMAYPKQRSGRRLSRILPVLGLLLTVVWGATSSAFVVQAAIPPHVSRGQRMGHFVHAAPPEHRPLAHNESATLTVLGSGDLVSQGGPVQHSPTSYFIFWGANWEGSDFQNAQSILNYFNDMGGTPFENILTQYYDSSGHITNTHRSVVSTFDSTTPHQ